MSLTIKKRNAVEMQTLATRCGKGRNNSSSRPERYKCECEQKHREGWERRQDEIDERSRCCDRVCFGRDVSGGSSRCADKVVSFRRPGAVEEEDWSKAPVKAPLLNIGGGGQSRKDCRLR